MDRDAFQNFLNSVVAPNKKPTQADTRVDPYGNFTIVFTTIKDKSFANTKEIENIVTSSKLEFFDVDLHKFIKNINDVELNIHSSVLELPGVSYAFHRLMPMNSANNITMYWLNTKTPYIETIFVPWMRANTLDAIFPIAKVDLSIQFPKLAEGINTNIVYKYYGIRPIECSLHKMTNEAVTEFYRKVTFDFDYFYIDTAASNGGSLKHSRTAAVGSWE